jgi:hypothetical protein
MGVWWGMPVLAKFDTTFTLQCIMIRRIQWKRIFVCGTDQEQLAKRIGTTIFCNLKYFQIPKLQITPGTLRAHF